MSHSYYFASYLPHNIPQVLESLHSKYKVGALETLTPAQCITQYATSIQSNRRHLLLVASDDKYPTAEQNIFINGSHVYAASSFSASDATGSTRAASSYDWMCSGMDMIGHVCSQKIDSVRSNPSAWSVGQYCPGQYHCEKTFPVEYCLSEPAEPHCRLQYDLIIAIVVTTLNFGKPDFTDLTYPTVICHSTNLCVIWKKPLAGLAWSDIRISCQLRISMETG
jgi:hypothetical protein